VYRAVYGRVRRHCKINILRTRKFLKMADENIENGGSKSTSICESSADMQIDMFSDTWGFSIEDIYKIAVTFYKGLYMSLMW